MRDCKTVSYNGNGFSYLCNGMSKYICLKEKSVFLHEPRPALFVAWAQNDFSDY